ncbi:MAG: choice-of-anchor A family protein [Deltaproteobacteria bacterium]|nr:choice-of-anchor A family protein [Deltaproteobacteria bacterium]
MAHVVGEIVVRGGATQTTINHEPNATIKDVRISNCWVEGMVRVYGKGSNGSVLYDAARRNIDPFIAPREALRTKLDNLHITNRRGIDTQLMYLGPGARYTVLQNSELDGDNASWDYDDHDFESARTIYLGAETSHTLIRNNYIHYDTGGAFDGRDQISIDTSSHNIIVGNKFSSLTHGAIRVFRNSGEKPSGRDHGLVRRRAPAYNHIINNQFYYKYEDNHDTHTTIIVGFREGSIEEHNDEDNGLSFGSSVYDGDLAHDNVVAWNRFDEFTLSQAIEFSSRSFNNHDIENRSSKTGWDDYRPSPCYVPNAFADLEDEMLLDGDVLRYVINAGTVSCLDTPVQCVDGVLHKVTGQNADGTNILGEMVWPDELTYHGDGWTVGHLDPGNWDFGFDLMHKNGGCLQRLGCGDEQCIDTLFHLEHAPFSMCERIALNRDLSKAEQDIKWLTEYSTAVNAAKSMAYPTDFNVFVQDDIFNVPDSQGPIAAGRNIDLRGTGFNINHNTNSTAPPGSVAAVAGGEIHAYQGTFRGDVFYKENLPHATDTSYDIPPITTGYVTPENIQNTFGDRTYWHQFGPYVTLLRHDNISPAWAIYSHPIDFDLAFERLKSLSQSLLARAQGLAPGSPTLGSHEKRDNWQRVFMGANPVLNEFIISASELRDGIYGIKFEVPPESNVIVNVIADGDVKIQGMNIELPLEQANKVLWNVVADEGTANELRIVSIQFKGSVLAPNLDAKMSWGQFRGTLIAKSLAPAYSAQTTVEFYHVPFTPPDFLGDSCDAKYLPRSRQQFNCMTSGNSPTCLRTMGCPIGSAITEVKVQCNYRIPEAPLKDFSDIQPNTIEVSAGGDNNADQFCRISPDDNSGDAMQGWPVHIKSGSAPLYPFYLGRTQLDMTMQRDVYTPNQAEIRAELECTGFEMNDAIFDPPLDFKFECSQYSNNAPCQTLYACPVCTEVTQSMMACNLEYGRIDYNVWGAMPWDTPGELLVYKESDYVEDGICGAGIDGADIQLRDEGDSTPLDFTGDHSDHVYGGCKENDENGADCYLKTRLKCSYTPNCLE